MTLLKSAMAGLLVVTLGTNVQAASCKVRHNASSQKTVDPNNFNQTTFAKALLVETNAYRCSKRRKALKGDKALTKAALMQSRNMVATGLLNHTQPVRGEKEMRDRFRKAKVKKKGISAENIAYLFKIDVDDGSYGITSLAKCQFTHPVTKAPLPEYTYARLAARVVSNWSTSPGHKKIMLLKQAGRMGGAAYFKPGRDLCGKWYITQTFAG